MIKKIVYMEAVDLARNISRGYTIRVGQDLFGDWIVEINYGRIGARGRTMMRVFKTEREAYGMVKQAVDRRRTSVRRIGVPYVHKLQNT